MLDQRRVAAQPDEKRERLFTERYESLLAWAMRLTNNQRDAAEDLVQDAFVQFVLGRSRLEEIENVEGYLRRMLRYMHVSRLSRSAQRLHDTALSIADYDSGHVGWTVVEPPRRMQASEELLQICTYACSRKESSRAGSVLILRFFHDYFPTEIAAVLNSSRHCVDEWQRLARREAKLFMNEPRRLRFVDAKTQTERQQVKFLGADCDLMLELRQMIFNSCQGNCVSKPELEEIYSNGKTDALTTVKLAHIVSCPHCLDAVNSMLGLPLLAERYHSNPSEPKEPPSDPTGGGVSVGGSNEIGKKFARRLRETHEHKPQELRIAVNGVLVSTVKVNSELSELDLNLTPDEPIEFIEVSSEQGLQLLFFSVDAPGRQFDQWAWIELSDGRSLEACYQDENGPTLHVVYKDSAPADAFSTGEINVLSSPLAVVPAVNELSEPSVGTRGRISKICAWVVRLLKSLSTTAGGRVAVREAKSQSSADTFAGAFVEKEEVSFLSSFGKTTDRKRSWRLLFVLMCGVVIAGFLVFRASLSSVLTASALLEKASIAENNSVGTGDTIKHRFINLEERRSAQGAVVARRRIEIWSNHAKSESAQRLYDDSNQLIAAVWQKADGSRTVYHHGSKPQAQAPLASPENLFLNVEDIWQLEPSPGTFGKLIAKTDAGAVEEGPTTYVLSFENGRTIGNSHLLKATLTLNKSDLHSIEQTLLVRLGNGIHEYRFVEAGFELLPSQAVAPRAFEVEPELTGGAGELGRPEDWALRDLTASRVPPPPSTSTPPAASAELEVDVAYLLNHVKADLNEQVTLTRSEGGSLRVEGVVDSEQRKNEFLRALAPVINNPAVRIDIRTVAEAMERRRTKTGTITVQGAEATTDTIAADQDLRSHFERHNPGGPIDEAVRNYSSRMVNRAYRTLFHAIEMKRLMSRFANVDMRTVAPDARAKWLAMLHQHAAAFENQNAVLRQEIQPIFYPAAALHVADEPPIENDAELARAVERLHRMALSNNEAIRAAFTISSQSSAAAIKSPAFWVSILRVENLAKRIAQYQTASG
jgi:RNA polymerase sigma factor (sigma-70 family)